MGKVEVGQLVKHIKYGFEGVVEGTEENGTQAVIKITEGTHPFNDLKHTYTAYADNLELIDVEDKLEQFFNELFKELSDYVKEDTKVTEELAKAIEVSTEDEVDFIGKVEVVSPDGTIMKFELYTDFVDFMQKANTLQK